MFGLLVIFSQLCGEPWDGNNAGLLEGLTPGPHHIKLTGVPDVFSIMPSMT